MSDLVTFVQDAIIQYIFETFDVSSYVAFTSIGKILGSLESDWEDEMKEEVWRRILQRIDGRKIVDHIASFVPDEESSDEDTNE